MSNRYILDTAVRIYHHDCHRNDSVHYTVADPVHRYNSDSDGPAGCFGCSIAGLQLDMTRTERLPHTTFAPKAGCLGLESTGVNSDVPTEP